MDSNQDESMKELAQFFHGYVKVTFKYLSFPLLLFRGRIFDNKNVNLLKRTFRLKQCARLEPSNYISAVISDDVLEQAML